MSTAARAIAIPAEPFEVPDRLHAIRDQIDWTQMLPEQAEGRAWQLQRIVKRAADVIIAALALLVLVPLTVALAIALRGAARRPAVTIPAGDASAP